MRRLVQHLARFARRSETVEARPRAAEPARPPSPLFVDTFEPAAPKVAPPPLPPRGLAAAFRAESFSGFVDGFEPAARLPVDLSGGREPVVPEVYELPKPAPMVVNTGFSASLDDLVGVDASLVGSDVVEPDVNALTGPTPEALASEAGSLEREPVPGAWAPEAEKVASAVEPEALSAGSVVSSESVAAGPPAVSASPPLNPGFVGDPRSPESSVAEVLNPATVDSSPTSASVESQLISVDPSVSSTSLSVKPEPAPGAEGEGSSDLAQARAEPTAEESGAATNSALASNGSPAETPGAPAQTHADPTVAASSGATTPALASGGSPAETTGALAQTHAEPTAAEATPAPSEPEPPASSTDGTSPEPLPDDLIALAEVLL
ncbi:MAG: hypothetical protein SFW67_10020 [Myxococcaceae bacterium]|nr:hypothetical protein [Myxococcaceae bacterium]